MVALPNTPTIEGIYAQYILRDKEEPRRGYLGASEIGTECYRALWYSFRWCKRVAFEGRMLRLFNTGHREEERIIDDLRAVGVEVLDKDPSTGQQWRFTACNGHFSGGLDGVAKGLIEAPKSHHLLECKTANKKQYDKLVKEGVQKAKPRHYDQMQILMNLSKLRKAVYLCQCKDDDRLYMERIKLDNLRCDQIMQKAERIINASSPLERISDKPDFWQCRFCDYRDICQGEKVPEANCRTCMHSAPAENGQWYCGRACANVECMAACDQHLYIPDLLHWANPIDGELGSWVLYSAGRVQFVNVAQHAVVPTTEKPMYASSELQHCEVTAIGNKAVEAARTILGGSVVPF